MYKAMQRKAKAGHWWMVPLVDFTAVVVKKNLLRVESWAMKQFPNRLNGLHQRIRSRSIRECSNRPIKSLNNLIRHRETQTQRTISEFQGWTFAGCIGPQGECLPLHLALAAHWPEFLCHPADLQMKARAKRTWGSSTLVWIPIEVDWHRLKISKTQKEIIYAGSVRKFLRDSYHNKSWMVVMVVTLSKHKLSDEEVRHMLTKLLGAGCKSSNLIASEFTTIELWQLWGKVGRLALKSERSKVRAQITSALRRKGLNITPGQRISLCCPIGTNARVVKSLVRQALRKSLLHQEVATKIRITVTATKATTGMDMLVNHKHWIHEMDPQTPLRCKCASCPDDWDKALGHKVCRSRKFCQWSLKSPLVMDKMTISMQAQDILWSTLEARLPAFTIQNLELWHAGRRLTSTSEWLATQTRRDSVYSNCHGLDWQAMNTMKQLTSEFVTVPIDKAPGEVLFCCPAYYEKLFDRSFIVNGDYYVKEGRNPEEVLQHLKRHWRKHWSKLGAWDNRGDFPVPYVMPKSKDLQKARPIIPYTKHPLRKVYSAVGVAHSFIMKKLPTHLSFNIMDTADFASRVASGMAEGRRRYGPKLAWKCVFGDLSNMYTELRHTAIESAVHWGMEKSKLCTRLSLIAVDRRTRAARKGRAWAEGTAEIDLSTISEVSSFDNSNMFLYVKGKLVRQCHGCPMGSNLSPPKAMVTCSPPEAEFLKTANRLNALTVNARFMDDVGVFVAFEKGDQFSEELADSLCSRVKLMYPQPLVLELVDPIAGRYKFLESIVEIRDGDILVRHCAPTSWSRSLYGTAPGRLELHPECDKEVLFNRLVCEWHRAERNSVQNFGLLTSVWERCLTLIHEGYPTTVLCNSLGKMCNRDVKGEAVWQCATDVMRMMCRAEITRPRTNSFPCPQHTPVNNNICDIPTDSCQLRLNKTAGEWC